MSESGKPCCRLQYCLRRTALPADAATEADRIAALEAQLQQQQAAMQQQQRMMEAMQAELQRLKADEAGAPVATRKLWPQQPAPAASAATSGVTASEQKLSMTSLWLRPGGRRSTISSGWTPTGQDTLRVTTIPTQSGAYGNDGDFLFSVRQSRLGVKGDYGPDMTYKLEGELFGVGGGPGSDHVACGMPMRRTRIS